MANARYATSSYPAGSKLRRIQWFIEGMIKASKEQSFFNQFMAAAGTSQSHKGILVKTVNRKAGELVRMEEEGYFVEPMVRRPNVLRGTGEDTRIFGTDIKLFRFGKEAKIGDEWDAESIGRSISEVESRARKNISEYIVRAKDQSFYDLAQMHTTIKGAHGIALNTLGSDEFMDIRQILRTGMGWNAGNTNRRMPITGFNTANDGEKLLMIVDSYVVNKHFKDIPTKTLYLNGDVRGTTNPLFTNSIRDFGDIRTIEAPSFVGKSAGNLFDAEGYYNYENLLGLQGSGMRVFNPTSPVTFTPQAWQDEPGFSWSSPNGIISVAFILGRDAIFSGTGTKDFRWDMVKSQDYEITSDIAVQLSMSAKLRTLEEFNGDYDVEEAGIYNVIPVYIRIK